MKRWTMLFLALLLPLCAARAQGIHADALRLFEQAYPGYAVLAQDGYDDGTTGQWAAVLERDGDNVLLIAERTGGGSYALTLDNPNAVPDEGDGYSRSTHTISVKLLEHFNTQSRLGELDLVISQPDAEQWLIVSELLEDGRTWGAVSSTYTLFEPDGRTVWWSHVFAEDGSVSYMRHAESPDGTPLRTDSYPRLPVGGESAQMHLLERFDAGAYPRTPDRIPADRLGDYAAPFVPQGHALVQLDLQEHALLLLVESPQGVRTLRILPHENWQFLDVIVTGPLPAGASLDTFHADEGELQLRWFDGRHEYQFGFAQRVLAGWDPAWLMIDSTTYRFTPTSIACTEDAVSPQRNDGVRYGRHPWQAIETIDFGAIPAGKAEMFASLDQRMYAVVHNPDPQDRLHLRELPRSDARSLGKFYNRTPVLVLSVDGGWAKVAVGSLTGYMMVKYLAFGAEMEGVACAFPQLFIREEYDTLPLQPWQQGRTVGHIGRDTPFYIVGVEDDRYVILTEDGRAGYVKQAYFYPGNG